jgi:hypothetical protein
MTREIVFIDDDELILKSWELAARDKEISLHLFQSVDSFILVSEEFPREVEIYIDSNLGENIKGEIESEKLSKLGFLNIYLATGHNPDDMDQPKWIKKIIGKRAPF